MEATVFFNFEKAYFDLTEASKKTNLDKLYRAGLIQIFEITFELAWKTLKDKLEFEGYEVISPRAVLKTAFQADLLTDGEKWIQALDRRNLLSHSYDESLSLEVCDLIRTQYAPMIRELYLKLKSSSI